MTKCWLKIFLCTGTAVKWLCWENFCWIRMLLSYRITCFFHRITRQISYSFSFRLMWTAILNAENWQMQKGPYRIREWFEILILWKPMSILYADEIILVSHDECLAVINTISLLHQSVLYVCLHIYIFLSEFFQFFWKAARN